MSSPEDVRNRLLVKQIVEALKAFTRGDATVIEIIGSSPLRDDLARSVVNDFIQEFSLDVTFIELPSGFRVVRHGVRVSETELGEGAIHIAA